MTRPRTGGRGSCGVDSFPLKVLGLPCADFPDALEVASDSTLLVFRFWARAVAFKSGALHLDWLQPRLAGCRLVSAPPRPFPGQKVFKFDLSAGAFPQRRRVTEELTAANQRRVLEKRANQEGAGVCPEGLIRAAPGRARKR